MSFRVFSTTLLACAAFALLVAAPASAAPRSGWDDPVVTYFVASKLPYVKQTATIAARNWNDLGLNIKLKRVSSRRKAKIVVNTKPPEYFPGTAVGLAGIPHRKSARYRPTRRVSLNVTRSYYVFGDPLTPSQPVAIAVMTHEFGHTLGLRHAKTDSCAVMEPNARSACGTGLGNNDSIQCGPTSRDYSALKKLYRKRPGRKPALRTCSAIMTAANTAPSAPRLVAGLQWSKDGVTWSAADGSVPAGTTILVRDAITVDALPFPETINDDVLVRYRNGAVVGDGGASLVSSCVAQTPAASEPAAATPCFATRQAAGGGTGYFRAPIDLLAGGVNYWSIRKFKLDVSGIDVQFSGAFSRDSFEFNGFTDTGLFVTTT